MPSSATPTIVTPPGHNLARDSAFWNRLHGAMLQVGKELSRRNPSNDGFPVGDYLAYLREFFRGHRWTNSERIYQEHVIEIAKASPEFTILDGSSVASPKRIKMT